MALVQLNEVKKQVQRYFTFLICAIPFLLLTANNIYYAIATRHQHFSVLANAFLHGRLSFLTAYEHGFDAVLFHGNYYWPLGPFPAILILPFVALGNLFHTSFHEAYIHLFLFLSIWVTWYYIGKKLTYTTRDALYWTYAFCFSSTLFGVAFVPLSWQFAQLVTVLLVSLALYEYLTKKRMMYIGLLLGLTAATRITAGLGIIFFIFIFLNKKYPLKKRIKQLGLLLLPFGGILLLLLLYNFARFGSITEQGYNLQILFNPSLNKAREYGIFNLVHIPGNLYYFFLATPHPVFKDTISHVLRPPFIEQDDWGLGLFVISPYYIYLIFLHYRDRISKLLWITVLIIALPIFCYYGIGYSQYGYRYSLDFLPFLFFLLIKNYREQLGALSLRTRIFIILAVMWNIYLLIPLSIL